MIGTSIKEQINHSRLSRKEIADRLGISYFTLSNKLNGFAPFSLEEERAIKSLISEATGKKQ